MQTLFRNALAEPYILGVSSGASLGVALVTMASGFLPAFLMNSGWATIIAAIIGGAFVLLLVLGVSFRIQSAVSLLIVGIPQISNPLAFLITSNNQCDFGDFIRHIYFLYGTPPKRELPVFDLKKSVITDTVD